MFSRSGGCRTGRGGRSPGASPSSDSLDWAGTSTTGPAGGQRARAQRPTGRERGPPGPTQGRASAPTAPGLPGEGVHAEGAAVEGIEAGGVAVEGLPRRVVHGRPLRALEADGGQTCGRGEHGRAARAGQGRGCNGCRARGSAPRAGFMHTGQGSVHALHGPCAQGGGLCPWRRVPVHRARGLCVLGRVRARMARPRAGARPCRLAPSPALPLPRRCAEVVRSPGGGEGCQEEPGGRDPGVPPPGPCASRGSGRPSPSAGPGRSARAASPSSSCVPAPTLTLSGGLQLGRADGLWKRRAGGREPHGAHTLPPTASPPPGLGREGN